MTQDEVEFIKRELAAIRRDVNTTNERLSKIKEALYSIMHMTSAIFGAGKAESKTAWESVRELFRKDW